MTRAKPGQKLGRRTAGRGWIPLRSLHMSAQSISLDAVRLMDASDPFRGFREEFLFPHMPGKGSGQAVYLTGNSLGLQHRGVRGAIEQELDDWARLGVEGHLHGRHPWYPYHEFVREPLARIVGAQPHEVVAMNGLTVNLHLLMVSFYRPTRERFKIMIEDAAFPSDSYAMQTQIDFHARAVGFDAKAGLIRLRPREGEATLRTEDIVDAIEREAESLTLVVLGGVNYLTGQFFDIGEITRNAHERNVLIGWDLAHAAGNVPLRMHDWDADFAAWCSYKYLNAGPGAVAGAFVHERHLGRPDLPRFGGWWGNDPATRFRMTPDFVPVASADAWALSNPPIFSLAPLRVSLEVFDRAGGVARLREKSEAMTGLMETMLRAIPGFEIITPSEARERGCQLSLVVRGDARAAHQRLTEAGIICDFREPNVIRAAPVPLYNSFEDVWRFAETLRAQLG